MADASKQTAGASNIEARVRDNPGASAPSVLWQTLYWAALALLLWLIKGAHVLDPDEGMVLEGAWNLLNGRELYVDSFQIVAPGAFYVIYWVWKVFGVHHFLAQLVGLAGILATALAIFRITSLFNCNRYLAYCGPLFYCLASAQWAAISYNAFNACAMAWALYFCVRCLKSGSTKDAVFGGLLTGVSILFVQHKGLVFFGTTCAFYAITWLFSRSGPTRKHLLYYFAFSLAPLLLLLKWPPLMLFDQLIHMPMTHYVAINRVSYVPLFIAAVYVVLSIPAQWKSSRALQFLLVIQAALLATSLQRTDWPHILILSFPFCALFPMALESRARSGISRAVYYVPIAGLVVFSVSWAVAWALGTRKQEDYHARLMSYVREHCDSVYAGPFFPSVYYEARKLNPTSFPSLITGFNTSDQFAKARAQLERARPQCAVMAYGIVAQFNYSKANPVDEFIKENYKLVEGGDESVFPVYKREN